MWGRLSEFVQEKLDSSIAEDEQSTSETVCIFDWHIRCAYLILILLLVHIISTSKVYT